MKRAMVAMMLGALLLGGIAAAQELPPGKWWRQPEVVKQLRLTPQQQAKLDQVFSTSAPELIDLRAGVERAAVTLRSQLDRDDVDRDAVLSAAAQVSDARARLFERELSMLVDMRSALDDGQWARFRTMLESRPRRATGRQAPMMPRGGMGQGQGPGRGGRRP